MKISLIAEGSTSRERKTLRWGVSFLVGDVFFDAFGRADVFWENVKRFKFNLTRVRHVVISHDDWDHIAGLGGLLRTQPQTQVYVCKKAGKDLKNLVKSNGGILVEVNTVRKISHHVYSIGQMSADTGRGILYEQALVVKSRKGFSVITGCAHPGIVKIVKRAIKEFGDNIYAICGGFHMKDNDPEENIKIVADLKTLGVKKVIPLHCSGPGAAPIFARFFGKHCVKLREGESFDF